MCSLLSAARHPHKPQSHSQNAQTQTPPSSNNTGSNASSTTVNINLGNRSNVGVAADDDLGRCSSAPNLTDMLLETTPPRPPAMCNPRKQLFFTESGVERTPNTAEALRAGSFSLRRPDQRDSNFILGLHPQANAGALLSQAAAGQTYGKGSLAEMRADAREGVAKDRVNRLFNDGNISSPDIGGSRCGSLSTDYSPDYGSQAVQFHRGNLAGMSRGARFESFGPPAGALKRKKLLGGGVVGAALRSRTNDWTVRMDDEVFLFLFSRLYCRRLLFVCFLFERREVKTKSLAHAPSTRRRGLWMVVYRNAHIICI